MSFFNKINNHMIVNVIKEILKGWDPEESLSFLFELLIYSIE